MEVAINKNDRYLGMGFLYCPQGHDHHQSLRYVVAYLSPQNPAQHCCGLRLFLRRRWNNASVAMRSVPLSTYHSDHLKRLLKMQLMNELRIILCDIWHYFYNVEYIFNQCYPVPKIYNIDLEKKSVEENYSLSPSLPGTHLINCYRVFAYLITLGSTYQ